jgi:hypothetical protein
VALIGGRDSYGLSDKCFFYDQEDKKYLNLPALNTKRDSISVCFSGNFLFAIWGREIKLGELVPSSIIEFLDIKAFLTNKEVKWEIL